MKFLAKKGAPDIPLEVLEAQEAGRLVIFCGAGISYPAGLPGFSGLVDQIYGELGATKESLEKSALEQYQYDRALELLERRHDKGPGKPNPMREAIGKLLDLNKKANVDTHKSILQIAKGSNGDCRVVTTNFDHGFLLADPSTKSISHAAPRLPVPKPHRWNSVVYLHGLIDSKSDPRNENLVLTSGDFGAAYLTERWASKFVTELFGYYTLLFIGYSIEDPVIRYMTDAIAADRRGGLEETRQPYVLARTKPKGIRDDEEAWQAKGVEPILYHSDRSHGHLHQTLKKWAAYCRDGLNAKERVIRTKATIAPLPPYQEDEVVHQILDILREKENLTDTVTGHPARVFAALDDPPAPVEWLPVFVSEGLLERCVVPGTVKPLHPTHGHGVYSKPNLISRNLWGWLCHHLESRELVNWVIDNGPCLHPDFAFMVRNYLKKNSVKSPFHTFWNALALGLVFCGEEGSFYEIEEDLANGDYLALRRLSQLLVPSFRFKKFYDWEGLYSSDGESPSRDNYFDTQVTVGLQDYEFNELVALPGYPNFMTKLLPEVTGHLSSALQMRASIGKADSQCDGSYWDIPSIEPHAQNQRYQNWSFLIELCRDLWLTAYDQDSQTATAIFSQWVAGEFPAFTRLALFAAANRPVIEPDAALDLLLGDGNWWLWSLEVHREKYRLLARIWPLLTIEHVERLTEAIQEGPPRAMYKEELEQDEWNYIRTLEIWRHLEMLQTFGRELPRASARELQRIKTDNPDWELQGGDRDEFIGWSESGSGYRTDISIEALKDADVIERIQILQSVDGFEAEGRVDMFRVLCQENFEIAVESLLYLAAQQIWVPKIWHAALSGVANSEDPRFVEIAPLLLNASDELFEQEAWVIAYWLRKSASELVPDGENERIYFRLFDRTYESALKLPVELDDDILNQSINNPIGILAESILDRIGSRKIERDQGMPEGSILVRLNEILNHDREASLLGIVILYSRLHYFHAIDPEWCRKEMIVKLKSRDTDLLRVCWIGFFWVPRISIGLATDIAPMLLDSLVNREIFGKKAEKASELFGLICLEYPEVFKVTEKKRGLENLGQVGYQTIGKLIWRSLKRDKIEDDGLESSTADKYWRGRVKPFIILWSKDARNRSEKRSQYLALAILQLTKSFADSISVIRPLLCPISRPGMVFRSAGQREDLIESHPREIFMLADELFPEAIEFPDRDLRALLNRIARSLPEIRDEARFREIDQLLAAMP